jgi:cytochrome c-type biogenesis protein CcmH/NrfG
MAEQLARRHPDEPLAWLFLADACLASGDQSGAQAAMAKARSLGYRGRDDVPEIVAPARPH